MPPRQDPQKLQQVAEDITNTLESQDKTVTLVDTPQPPVPKPDDSKQKPSDQQADDPAEPDEDDGKKPRDIAGFNLGDLAKAPFRPPSPEKTEGRAATDNRKVVLMVAIALVLLLIGLALCLTGFVGLGLACLALAALTIVAGVFLPIH